MDEHLFDHPAQTEYRVMTAVRTNREGELRVNCSAQLQFVVQRCFGSDVAQSLSYRVELDGQFWNLLSHESGELYFPPHITEANITFQISPLQYGELPMPCLVFKKIEKSKDSQDSKMYKPVIVYNVSKAEFVHVQ